MSDLVPLGDVAAILVRERAAIAEMTRPEEVAQAERRAAAIADLTKRAGLAVPIQNEATLLRAEALARLAELVDREEKPKGGRGKTRPESGKVSSQRLAEGRKLARTGAVEAARRQAEAEPDRPLSMDAILNTAKRAEREERRRESERGRLPSETIAEVREGDFREQLTLEDEVDVVMCDPPYAEEHLELYAALAEWAAVALKDDGLLAVMTGQTYLPQVFEALGDVLPYRWTIAYLTPGGQAVQVFPRKVNAFWKPVLLYGAARDWLGDVARSRPNDNDKGRHEWGQSASGMLDLLGRLVKPGDLVVDPMMGAGTTGQAALELGCRFIGCELDQAHAATARERLLA